MRLRWMRTALLAAVVLAAGLTPLDRGAVTAVQRGDELATARHYGAALDAYGTAAERCPGCPLPRQRQAGVYLAQARHQEAWTAYVRAIRLGGTDETTLAGMVQLYAARGSHALAIDTQERLLARRPLWGDAWQRLAEMALDAGDESRARTALARALALGLAAARRQRAHDRLGVLNIEGDAARAVAHLTEAARGPDPDLAGQAARLVAALEALDGSGDPALARAQLGEALYRHGDLRHAQWQFERALETAPAYVDAHAYLGHVLSLLGEDDRAMHHLEQAMALEPAYPLPAYFLGMHHVRKGWIVTGREVLLRAHDLDPSNPAICAAVADTYLRADRAGYAAAERWLHAAVDRAPDDARFHLLLAHFYVDYNVDPSVRGVAVAQVAVGLDPENGEALETLGWAYHLGSKPNAALDPLLRAAELGPASARIYFRLGEVYRALARRQDANDAYQQAVDLDWGGTLGERARSKIEAPDTYTDGRE